MTTLSINAKASKYGIIQANHWRDFAKTFFNIYNTKFLKHKNNEHCT